MSPTSGNTRSSTRCVHQKGECQIETQDDQPRHWRKPETTLEQKDVFRIMKICQERLPVKSAQILMMREWLELKADEICKELNISMSNIWVIL